MQRSFPNYHDVVCVTVYVDCCTVLHGMAYYSLGKSLIAVSAPHLCFGFLSTAGSSLVTGQSYVHTAGSFSRSCSLRVNYSIRLEKRDVATPDRRTVFLFRPSKTGILAIIAIG